MVSVALLVGGSVTSVTWRGAALSPCPGPRPPSWCASLASAGSASRPWVRFAVRLEPAQFGTWHAVGCCSFFKFCVDFGY